MLNLIELFSSEADTSIVMPSDANNELYQVAFIKEGKDTPFGVVSLTVNDCYEFMNEKLDSNIIAILDRVVLIDTLRRHLSSMRTTKSDIIDVFANGRTISAKLQLSTPTANEVMTAIFDRDNEELIIQPENIEDANMTFAPWQIKDEYVHLDKETIKEIQLNLKLNHLKRTDPECLIAAFCDMYEYMQENK